MKNQKYDYELYSAYLYHRTEIASYLENYIKNYLDKLAPCMLYFRVNIKLKTVIVPNIQVIYKYCKYAQWDCKRKKKVS